MNENYVGAMSAFRESAEKRAFAQQEQSVDPKPMGLSSSIQSLVVEVHEAASLSENLLVVLGLSRPEKEESANRTVDSAAEVIRLAVSMLRTANGKLSDALQHISS